MNLIDKINKKQINPNVPDFQVGDTVRVDVKIKEGSVSETFTVRKKSGNVGINRVFPVNSPIIEKITVVKKGKVRRAKLNFLKGFKGTFKIKERN